MGGGKYLSFDFNWRTGVNKAIFAPSVLAACFTPENAEAMAQQIKGIAEKIP